MYVPVHYVFCFNLPLLLTCVPPHYVIDTNECCVPYHWGRSAADIDRERPMWEAAFGSRAEVTQVRGVLGTGTEKNEH